MTADRSTRSTAAVRRSAPLLLQRTSGWAALALILAVPLLWDTGAAEMFRGPKREAALALWAGLAAVFLALNFPWRRCWDRWWAPWAGVIGGGTASAVASSVPAHTLLCLLPVVAAALGWGTIRQFTAEWRERLASAVVTAGVLQGGMALLFLLPRARPGSWRYLEELSGRYQWLGTMGNPGDVAVFLVLPALLALSMAVASSPPRWVLLGAGVFQSLIILATGTLTATAALLVGGAVMLWRNIPAPRRSAVATGATLLAVVIILVSPLRGRIENEIDTVRRIGWSAVGSYRGASYVAAARMIAGHPVTGVGFGRFGGHSFRYQSEEVLAQRGRMLGLETGFGHAHNDILQYGAETGILGLLLAGAGLAYALRSPRSRSRVLPHLGPLAAAAVVVTLTQFPLHLTAVAAQWVVVGALAVPALPTPPAGTAWSRRVRASAVVVCVVVAGWGAWQRHVTWRGVRQGDLLVRVIRQAPTPGARREVARAALAGLESRRPWVPEAWAPDVTLGNLAMEAGDSMRAQEYFARALKLADRPEIRFNLGMAELAKGDRELGLVHLHRAVELNPRVFGEIRDPALRRDLRIRLENSGYGARHPWIFDEEAR